MKTISTLGLRAALAATTILGSAAALPLAAHAQESQASLRGVITPVAGSTIQEVAAVEVQTGYRRVADLTPDGAYNFASLRPGIYKLEITLSTGVRTSDEFQLSVGQNAGLDVDLNEVRSAADAPAPGLPVGDSPNDSDATSGGGDIVVSGNRIKSLEGGEVATTISQRLIDQLPQNNRNFLAFADLAPGVQFIEGANGNSRLQGDGQDSRTINVFIDGVGQKDFVLRNGITGQDSTNGNPFPQLAIGEYKVISSNYKAEFDQVSSVAITAITKSGTNEFHGSGFVDYTDQSLRDATPLEQRGTGKATTRDFQYGGSLGGPIIPDVMHFFVTYEGKRQEVPVDIEPGGGRLITSLPTEFQDIFGTTNRTFNENLYFGKINIAPTDTDLIEISVKYRDETGQNLNSGINSASTSTDIDTEEVRGVLRWEHTGPDWVNDFKATYQDVKWAPTPRTFENGRLFQATIRNPNNTVSRNNLFQDGGSANFQDKGQEGYTFQNDFTWTGLERHTIKTGVKLGFVKLNSLQQNFTNPLYTFNADLVAGQFNTTIPYRVQFGAANGPGNSVVTSDNFQYGAYIQDDWDVTDRLTLNLGLRWDYERTPAFLDYVTPADARRAVSPAVYPNLVNADYDINEYISNGNERKPFKNAFQPRIGFSYELDAQARFVVFGGYGRSYDRNQFDFLQQELSTGAFQTRTFNFQTGDINNPCTASPTCVPFLPIYLTEAGRQQLLANAGIGAGRELRFITNDLKVPYSDQFSLGLRTRFERVELEFGYSHVESRDGFVYLLGNRRANGQFFQQPGTTPPQPDSPFTVTPAGFGSIIVGDQGLETTIDKAYAKFQKRYSAASPWSLDATYTYSDATENRQYGETFSFDFPSIDDYPTLRSSGVPRHRIVTAGSVDTPIGVTLSARLTLQSPSYIKTVVNSIAPFERRIEGIETSGNGDRWGRRQLDFAFTKYVPFGFITDDFRLRFRVDIINAMNDRNFNGFNNDFNDRTRTAGSPTVYGERVGFGLGGPPRTVKLSTGFNF